MLSESLPEHPAWQWDKGNALWDQAYQSHRETDRVREPGCDGVTVLQEGIQVEKVWPAQQGGQPQ